MKMTGKHDGMALAERVRARDHMLCGTAKPGFLFRVGPEQQEAALRRRGASAMRFASRTSRGFVWVDADSCDARALRSWIALAERYVKSLPPKKRQP